MSMKNKALGTQRLLHNLIRLHIASKLCVYYSGVCKACMLSLKTKFSSKNKPRGAMCVTVVTDMD